MLSNLRCFQVSAVFKIISFFSVFCIGKTAEVWLHVNLKALRCTSSMCEMVGMVQRLTNSHEHHVWRPKWGRNEAVYQPFNPIYIRIGKIPRIILFFFRAIKRLSHQRCTGRMLSKFFYHWTLHDLQSNYSHAVC